MKKWSVNEFIDSIRPYACKCTFNTHLRGESKVLEAILKSLCPSRKTGEYTCTIHLEGVGIFVFVAEGRARDCGFGCSLIIDSALEEAMHSL
jgi:hypothetical protein